MSLLFYTLQTSCMICSFPNLIHAYIRTVELFWRMSCWNRESCTKIFFLTTAHSWCIILCIFFSLQVTRWLRQQVRTTARRRRYSSSARWANRCTSGRARTAPCTTCTAGRRVRSLVCSLRTVNHDVTRRVTSQHVRLEDEYVHRSARRARLNTTRRDATAAWRVTSQWDNNVESELS